MKSCSTHQPPCAFVFLNTSQRSPCICLIGDDGCCSVIASYSGWLPAMTWSPWIKKNGFGTGAFGSLDVSVYASNTMNLYAPSWMRPLFDEKVGPFGRRTRYATNAHSRSGLSFALRAAFSTIRPVASHRLTVGLFSPKGSEAPVSFTSRAPTFLCQGHHLLFPSDAWIFSRASKEPTYSCSPPTSWTTSLLAICGRTFRSVSSTCAGTHSARNPVTKSAALYLCNLNCN